MSTATTDAPAAAGPPTVAPPQTANERLRRALLRRGRRRATGLLVAVAAVFVGLQLWDGDATWVGYAEAMVEAGMVGGLADWFAVTALFRHPLGIPIPHTAIVVERKDQFGETFGDFVQTSLLTPDTLAERVRGAAVVPRVAAWLAEPANAARVARHAADAAVTAADLLRDDEVHRALEDVARRRIETTPLAPLAGRALRVMTEDGRHHDLLDVMLRALDRFLTENRASLRARFATESPVVAARGGGGPDLRAPARRRPARARRGGAQPATTSCASTSTPGSTAWSTSCRRPRRCARGARSSSTSCWPSPSCGPGSRRCGPT